MFQKFPFTSASQSKRHLFMFVSESSVVSIYSECSQVNNTVGFQQTNGSSYRNTKSLYKGHSIQLGGSFRASQCLPQVLQTHSAGPPLCLRRVSCAVPLLPTLSTPNSLCPSLLLPASTSKPHGSSPYPGPLFLLWCVIALSVFSPSK